MSDDQANNTIAAAAHELLMVIRDLIAENDRLRAKLDVHEAHYKWVSQQVRGSHESNKD